MDKPFYKSVSIMSAVFFGVIQTLEQQGVVPAGALQALADLVQNLLAVSTVFGIRRAIV